MYAIEAQDIKKSFDRGRTTALEGVSFAIDRGEIFGLIGPDGAGKSSLIRILATLSPPDAGQARVEGRDAIKDFKKIRPVIGYMPGRFSLYQDLTVEENLIFFARIFQSDLQIHTSLIEDIWKELAPFKTRPAGKLSGGMKQKLALCCALIHRPRILFLDEPSTGVDAVSRQEFWAALKKLQKEDNYRHGIHSLYG